MVVLAFLDYRSLPQPQGVCVGANEAHYVLACTVIFLVAAVVYSVCVCVCVE